MDRKRLSQMAILADERCTLRAPISFLIYSRPLLTISATAPLAASAALTSSRPPPKLSGRGAYYPNHIRDSGAHLPRFQSADPGKRRAVLRSLRNRRLQTAAGIAAPPRGSPAQLDRGTKPGDRGIVI